MSIKKKVINIFRKYKQYITYVIFGLLTTLVNWFIYITLTKIFNINVILSNAFAWLIAVVFAYFTNKIFVFESNEWKLKDICKEGFLFIAARCLSGGFEIIAFPILLAIGFNQGILGIKGFWAKVIISIVVTITNYVLSKWAIFKSK